VGCCMWAIVKMAGLQTRAFLHAGAMTTGARCRRANFRPRSWLTTWRQWGGEQALHVITVHSQTAHARDREGF